MCGNKNLKMLMGPWSGEHNERVQQKVLPAAGLVEKEVRHSVFVYWGGVGEEGRSPSYTPPEVPGVVFCSPAFQGCAGAGEGWAPWAWEVTAKHQGCARQPDTTRDALPHPQFIYPLPTRAERCKGGLCPGS